MTTDEAQTVALVPGRLFIHGTNEKTWRDASLPSVKRVSDVAMSWQETSSHAWLWELGGAVNRAGRGRAHEVAGLIGAGGEELALALSAAIEAELARTHIESVEFEAAFEMSRRAFVDLQVMYVTSAGHTLVNAAVRALAFDPELRTALGRDVLPFSDKKKHWASFNAPTVNLLHAVALGSRHPEVVALVRPVVDLGNSRIWAELLEQRGRDFHRWRLQSAGLAGAQPRDPWTKLENGGWTIRLKEGSDRTTPGDIILHGSRVATEAMTKLADTMGKFFDGFVRASGLLGGPQFASARRPRRES